MNASMAEHHEESLAEDLLLLLFQPDSGFRRGTETIAGENTPFSVLGGAVLTDLALNEQVSTEPGRVGTTLVKAVESRPPADDILRSAWDYVLAEPRGVQTVLVNGVEPEPRIAALAALISGSGNLPRFDPEIPWTSPVITRARELEQGNWGAAGAAQAVTRTVTAVVVSSVVVAAAVAPQH